MAEKLSIWRAPAAVMGGLALAGVLALVLWNASLFLIYFSAGRDFGPALADGLIKFGHQQADDAFYAEVGVGGDVVWLRSTDGGATWARSDEVAELSQLECALDGTCYRSQTDVETYLWTLTRVDAKGTARPDGELPDCAYGTLAVNPYRDSQVLMKCDAGHLAYRLAAQDWRIIDLMRIAKAHH